jgi:transposase InsO family protein
MSAKEALIFDVNDGMSVTAAAEKHGVARSCAYKWVGRNELDKVNGLEELSRRPEFSPNRIKQELVDELLALKQKHPSFGPAKLVPMLEERRGEHVMAVSTAGEILGRHGQVSRRKRRQPSPGRIEHPPFTVAGAGHSATTDFKGQFRLGDGLCYPLTIADPFSRYILAIVALASTHMAAAKAVFERVFREYGIPWQLINDNGTPFCSPVSLGGLTYLSRWWIELGIELVRIQPGRPDQNGIHERMHRTLKDWIKCHPQSSRRSQQRSFDAFRHEFNNVRPHQSLGQKPPSSAFRAYRPFPSRVPPLEYNTNMDVRKVNANGEIKWKGNLIFASEVLIGANVGLLQIGEALHAIYLGRTKLGYLDTLARRVMNRRPPDDEK